MGSSYWLTRIVFLRCLTTIYAIAFLVALNQNGPLIGDNGLTPATLFIKSNKHSESPLDLILSHPTAFWLVPPTSNNLSICAYIGLVVSMLVLIMGSANVPLMFVLWSAYFSIVNVGQTWYGFGWESQLLETGFLAMFMVPLISLDRFPRWTPTPSVCLWGYRWLLFRIMIGAGMIKIRGDQCWRDLTCMNYHYQTQPNPNPLSIYFHNNPEIFHMIETLGNHFVELVCPFLLLVPLRLPSIVGGVIQIAFQGILIASGNLAFLNWLTAVPAVACFDDQSLSVFFSESERMKAILAEANYQRELYRSASSNRFFTMTQEVAAALYDHKKHDDDSDDHRDETTQPVSCSASLTLTQSLMNNVLVHGVMYRRSWSSMCVLSRRVTGVLLVVVLAYLSQPVVMNILSPRQAMNVSFDSFRIVNSYGAFGSVTKVRHEVVLQGTNATTLTPSTQWYEFEFPCKPGDINRAPCVISPYHLRMDWLMWFAAFQNYQNCPWLVHFADKLLRGEEEVTRLLAPSGNPFDTVRHDSLDHLGVVFGAVSSVFGEGGDCCKGHSTLDHRELKTGYTPPNFIRAELYEYQYAPLSEVQRKKDLSEGWEVGRWWKRRHVSSYLPALEKGNESVRRFLQVHRLIEFGKLHLKF